MTAAEGGGTANERSKEIEMKKKTKTTTTGSRKLSLRSETLRALDDLKLPDVAGGMINMSSINETICKGC